MLPPIYLPTDADIVITAATDTHKMRLQFVFFPTLLHRSEIGSFSILRRPQRHGQLRRDLFNAPDGQRTKARTMLPQRRRAMLFSYMTIP
jgi:hypothetical protein